MVVWGGLARGGSLGWVVSLATSLSPLSIFRRCQAYLVRMGSSAVILYSACCSLRSLGAALTWLFIRSMKVLWLLKVCKSMRSKDHLAVDVTSSPADDPSGSGL